ncbi:olfactory receptor 6B1-like [Carettochelys insculpta]|uniref:olfactory receptor 6B1-like n=1 Tax=Carettochelys insculpta TaxID=44489 RepID=UPI003EBEA541
MDPQQQQQQQQQDLEALQVVTQGATCLAGGREDQKVQPGCLHLLVFSPRGLQSWRMAGDAAGGAEFTGAIRWVRHWCDHPTGLGGDPGYWWRLTSNGLSGATEGACLPGDSEDAVEKMEGRNQTIINEFILVGFGNGPELQALLFLVFLVIYIATVAGNILIIVLVVTEKHLHTPMYYLLGNLSCVETCYISTLLPRLLASLLTGDRTISVKSCIMQLYFFGILISAENLLLTAMSYDRYLAICHPLRYAALMSGRVCCQLVLGCWTSSFLLGSVVLIYLFQLKFCDTKEIDHFFCDYSPMIKLSCDDTRTVELMSAVSAVIGTLVSLLLTVTSYICIITAILRIPSTTGRQKAFSTCSSHLIVLTVFYVSVISVYVVPTANTPKVLHKIFSVFYTVLTPFINPVIYCLRNKEVKESLRKTLLILVSLGDNNQRSHRSLTDKF